MWRSLYKKPENFVVEVVEVVCFASQARRVPRKVDRQPLSWRWLVTSKQRNFNCRLRRPHHFPYPSWQYSLGLFCIVRPRNCLCCTESIILAKKLELEHRRSEQICYEQTQVLHPIALSDSGPNPRFSALLPVHTSPDGGNTTVADSLKCSDAANSSSRRSL